ncbi:MAG: oxidoreductase [Deltaproteobacteria bacterium CG23_combo_of_CG06-09_8_20_14_all_51_20]|nr:MAG: oxidoreductase [Deltaproteobacteria bacterium CG23_combo_of_CG06-09_8_20_14_all_51_20]PIV99148.1 MAG: oxidoreductase [Deltaproteobacteria bacterium CG17_big_fil_post_rev_8_21_14_2_50_51_6]PIY25736.1 MAG: oxidoreductase [Deltaproteobacteria bacterium CG_4_10_14_3_um_filter_51_14]PJB37437.1 MAG: oxidoreductase [Deltaproteobacteria bacterium CG_4_9_14_3_um_filter_51_14]
MEVGAENLKAAPVDLMFQPHPARIVRVLPQMEGHRLFQLRFVDDDAMLLFSHGPGQFVEVGIPGVGEAPISLSSPPTRQGIVEICVREAGLVTSALFRMNKGDQVALRGPFGRGFSTDLFKGHDLLLVAGGLGLAPLRSLLWTILDNRSEYGKLVLMYGSRSPDDVLFKYELLSLMNRADMQYLLSVDKDDEGIWRQYVGVVTGLFEKVELDPGNTYCALCGPPIMYRFVIREILKKKISPKRIFVSLERMMKCGVGKCGHCAIGQYYCCTDGPVFNYDEIRDVKEAL